MKHKYLLHHCVHILNSFNPILIGIEQHTSAYIQQEEIVDNEDQTFVADIFSGCVYNAKVINVITEGFYQSDGWNSPKSDKNLYNVLCYLSLFLLDGLGMADYRKIVRTQDTKKMFKFLTFFLNENNLYTWIKDEWCKVHEDTYVQVTLLSPLQRWLPELKEVVSQLQDKIYKKTEFLKSTKSVTEHSPFMLTKPRPRSVPIPGNIMRVGKSKGVPTSTYNLPPEIKLIREAKQRNQRRTEEQLIFLNKSQFRCATSEKSEKTKMRIHSVIVDQESKLKFDGNGANPLPSSNASKIPIKLNMATILREGALYQKREKDAIKKLNLLEAGAKKDSEFLLWQEEIRQKDLDNQMCKIEKRRLEGKLCHEEAILARQALIQDNRQQVLKMKKDAEEMMHEYVFRRLEEEKVLQGLVEDILTGHENAKQQQRKLQNYKHKIAKELNEESQELLQRAFEETAKEMQHKIDLVQKIRAMELAPRNTKKKIDWTRTAGHSLLSEMSIAELKERLSLMKAKQCEDEENKRDKILEAREAKEQRVMQKLEQISQHRLAESKKTSERQFAEEKKPEMSKPINPKLKALQQELEQKKLERIQGAEKNRFKSTKESAARNSSIIKQKKWKELEYPMEQKAEARAEDTFTGLPTQKLRSFGQRSRRSAKT